MASKAGLPWQQMCPCRKLFPKSCSKINFSKSRQILLVLLKYQEGSIQYFAFFYLLYIVNSFLTYIVMRI